MEISSGTDIVKKSPSCILAGVIELGYAGASNMSELRVLHASFFLETWWEHQHSSRTCALHQRTWPNRTRCFHTFNPIPPARARIYASPRRRGDISGSMREVTTPALQEGTAFAGKWDKKEVTTLNLIWF